MTTDHQTLRAKAEAATRRSFREEGRQKLADFHNAAHPQAVLALLDEIEALREAVNLSLTALTDVASMIDTIKQEWSYEGAWTEWDQGVREKITEALKAVYAALSHRAAKAEGVE